MLPEGWRVPPKKEKHSTTTPANSGLGFLGFLAVLATVGAGVGIGAYFDNAMATAFMAHVLAGIAIALINEISERIKKRKDVMT